MEDEGKKKNKTNTLLKSSSQLRNETQDKTLIMTSPSSTKTSFDNQMLSKSQKSYSNSPFISPLKFSDTRHSSHNTKLTPTNVHSYNILEEEEEEVVKKPYTPTKLTLGDDFEDGLIKRRQSSETNKKAVEEIKKNTETKKRIDGKPKLEFDKIYANERGKKNKAESISGEDDDLDFLKDIGIFFSFLFHIKNILVDS